MVQQLLGTGTGRRSIACAVLFVMIGLALYSQVVLHGVFLFDDTAYIVNNPMLTDILSRGSMGDPRYIGYLSFSLNYAISGEDAPAFHLFNVLVHIANSLLVLAMARALLRILGTDTAAPRSVRYAPFLAALLFLVHPIQTQAVSYVTQRFTSLATFFYLLAVWLYLVSRTRLERNDPSPGKTAVLYALSVLSAVLAMKTKEISFTLPVVLLMLEALVLKSSRFAGKRFFYPAPFAAACLLIPLSLIGPDLGLIDPGEGIAGITRAAKLHDLTSYPPLPYLFTQMRAIVVYLRTLVLPIGLRAVYDFPISYTAADARVLGSFLVLLSLAGCGYFLWRKGSFSGTEPGTSRAYRIAAIGIAWFFITLLVESSVIPIKDVIFEHRVYLPSAGFFIAAAALLGHAGRPLLETRGLFAAGAAAMLIVMPLSIGTYVRNDVWTDELKLWEDVVRKSPGKAIGYNNRGVALAKRGAFKPALEDLDRAISFYPKTFSERTRWENADLNAENLARSYSTRGDILFALGEQAQAREDFERARRLFSMPVDVDSLLLLADGFAKRGAYRYAVEEYNKILQWDPEHVEALNDRANAYSFLDRHDEAIRDFTRIIALSPDYIIAYHNRGIAYARTGKKDRAVKDFEQACSMGFRPSCESAEIARRDGT